MGERQRLLALLECYDNAISELYILGDRRLLDLILRLERRRRDASSRLADPETDRAESSTAPLTTVRTAESSI
jgi:hypothetical protein